MMIVIPMILIAVTLPFYYEPLLNGDPCNVLRLVGVLMFLAVMAVLWVKQEPPIDTCAPARS